MIRQNRPLIPFCRIIAVLDSGLPCKRRPTFGGTKKRLFNYSLPGPGGRNDSDEPDRESSIGI